MENEVLFKILSSYYVLEAKIRCYHWNVEGENFYSLHKLFEEQYDKVAEEIDEIAEQIRKLGEKVPANLENYAKNSFIDGKNNAEKEDDMLNCLIQSNEEIVKYLKQQKVEFEKDDEYSGVVVLIDDLLKSRVKDIWFLKSSLPVK